MAKKVAAAALQYSKWLSRFICWIWAIYRFTVVISATIQPSSAQALATTLYMLDWIMLANEGTYLVNSLGEKVLYSDRFVLRWLDKGGFQSIVKTAINNIANMEMQQEGDEDGGDQNG